MHFYKAFALIFLFTASLFSQDFSREEIDSLFSLYTSHRSSEYHPDHPSEAGHEKCGFGIINTLIQNQHLLNPQQQSLLKTLVTRPVLQTSIVSPKGYFRIHYDNDTPPNYDINAFAQAADFVYEYEINTLGYRTPPSDNGAGGDNKYDIYIMNIYPYYGETNSEFTDGGSSGPSFIKIHNNFNNSFFTQGLNAAKVTIAHEFHHAIQMSYILRMSDLYFYELSATAMEEFAYDDINDYYAYMPDYFSTPDKSLSQYSGYDTAIWNIFLEKKYGHSILKRQWELMPSLRALRAVETSLTEVNRSFKESYNEFGVWCWFTGTRAIPGKYFEEGNKYPNLNVNIKLQFTPPSRSVTINSKPLANNFVIFFQQNPEHVTLMDSLLVVITNSDVNSAINNSSPNSFVYSLFDSDGQGRIRLTTVNDFNQYYMTPGTSEPEFWTTSEVLNNVVIKEGISPEREYVYPSPFVYGRNSKLSIPVKALYQDNIIFEVELYVYTSAMELVHNSVQHSSPNLMLEWKNILSNKNEKLASGVYFYAVKSGGNTRTGKFVIINNE